MSLACELTKECGRISPLSWSCFVGAQLASSMLPSFGSAPNPIDTVNT